MTATMTEVPPRSPERQRLFDAIQRRDDAVFQHERVNDALGKLDDELFDRLEPAVRRAQEALEEAVAAAPERLVAEALGEPAGADAGPSVTEAESALKIADQALVDARSARSILRDELRGREYQVDQAKRVVDQAVSAVVSGEKGAVLDEFIRCSQRALRCAQILRTIGTPVQGSTGHGLMFRITDAPTTVDKLGTAFRPDPDWLSATAALREDADTPLPGLPDDVVVDGEQAAA
jgi:hypothetical protein